MLKNKIIRLLIQFSGITLLGFGIQLLVFTRLGASPIDAVSYYLAYILDTINPNLNNIEVLIGVANIIFGLVVAGILLLFSRNKRNLWSLLTLLVQGGITSTWGVLFNVLDSSMLSDSLRATLGFVAIFTIVLAISLMVVNDLVASPFDQLMVEVGHKLKSTPLAKFIIEVIYLALAAVLMLISQFILTAPENREFTQISVFTPVVIILSAILTGFFIKILSKLKYFEKIKFEKGADLNESKIVH